MNPSVARWSLEGKRAIVTGATKGIGRALVEQLGRLGAAVGVIARQPADVASTVDQLQGNGISSWGCPADVATEGGRAAILEAVPADWTSLDILVNNAGTNVRKLALEYSSEEIDLIHRTNLESAFELSRLFHSRLAAAGQSSVVFVGSVAGQVSTGTGAIYAMTKAAMSQLARVLAVEWATQGIRVNVVAPWYTRTPLAEPILGQENLRRRILARTPIGRIAEPDEVAAAIAFFCLPASSFVTGQTLAVDGGFLSHGYSPQPLPHEE